MISLSRRSFLKTAGAAIASFFLPRSLRAGKQPKSFWFLHKPSSEWWQVDDPVAWSLANARQPVLERARERLETLDASDPHRVIRLVVRRCGLNLLEVLPGRVVVHYWGRNGTTDLRPFFKRHGLARQDVEVVSIDRKREQSSVLHGDDYLFGDRMPCGFPLDVYRSKWLRRTVEEEDDRQAAPWSLSNYCWEGIEEGFIPWCVLKSVWRRENGPLCENCDTSTLVTSFGYVRSGLLNLDPKITRFCLSCRRVFQDYSWWYGPEWLLANLDDPLLPTWDNRDWSLVRYTLPWTSGDEARAVDLAHRLVACLNRIEGQSSYFVEVPTGKIVCIGKRGTVPLPRLRILPLRKPDIVCIGKRDTVPLPPFDGPEDRMEEWCRHVLRQLADEG